MSKHPVLTQVPGDLTAANFKTWKMTAALRWNAKVLEQAWQCWEDGTIEWRPVPEKDAP